MPSVVFLFFFWCHISTYKVTVMCVKVCMHKFTCTNVTPKKKTEGILSLIFILSRLHDSWGDSPHVTSPIWGPLPSCKQALKGLVFSKDRTRSTETLMSALRVENHPKQAKPKAPSAQFSLPESSTCYEVEPV